jgi:hypothetical protein
MKTSLWKKIQHRFFGASVAIAMDASSASRKQETDINFTRPYPVEFLEEIEKLVLTTPNLSQALKRSIQLGNTGHNVEVVLSRGDNKAALDEINELAESVYPNGTGADGLVNALWRQIMIKGASSLELIPSMDLKSIEKVALIPVETVRFKIENAERKIVQNHNGEEFLLNPEQYIYYPLFTDERSPYGIPPYLSALEIAYTQKDAIKGIAKIIKKIGLLGFIFAKLKIPFRGNESENEYQARLKKKLSDFSNGFKSNVENGAIAGYDDTTIEHHSVTSEARGAIDLFREIETQYASGIDFDPAMLGRSYSTTETYAGVVYYAFLASNKNVRRVIKRVLEKMYKTHLILRGYSVKRVRVKFNPDMALNPKEDAEAESIKIGNVIMKINAGLIDDDTGARELGYEKATGKKQTPQTAGLSEFLDFVGLAEKKNIPMYRIK